MLAQLQDRLKELEEANGNSRNFEVAESEAPKVDKEDELGSEVAAALGATSPETASFKGHSTSESASDLLQRLRAEQAASGAFGDSSDAEDASSSIESTPDASTASDDYASPQSADELTFSEPIDEAPIDTAAILAKFGHSLDDDSDGTKTAFLDDDMSRGSMPQSSASLGTPPPAPNPYGGADSTHSSSPSAPSASFDDDDDESIDDYMAQLMARVGGSSQPATPPIKPEQPKPAQAAAAAASPSPAATNAAPEQTQERSVPLDPAEFVPRAVAPEASSNLRALRAVANTSARSAIDRHQRRSFDNKAYICWFIAIVAAIVCFSMAFFAKEIVSLPTLVSMLALLISFFATINGLAFAAKAKVGVRATQQQLLASIEHVSDQNARRVG